MLVNGLPLSSAIWRREATWTTEHELAALQTEHQDLWFRIIAVLLGADHKRLPRPISFPRPGGEPEPEAYDEGEGAKQVARLFTMMG